VNLIHVTQTGEKTVRVNVSSEAVRRAQAAGHPDMHARYGRGEYVRAVLIAAGYRPDDAHGHPVYILPKRGISNSGFLAIVRVQ
jgi:hypothetical protein